MQSLNRLRNAVFLALLTIFELTLTACPVGGGSGSAAGGSPGAGCVDSPESPTIVLVSIGLIALALPFIATFARRLRHKQ
jgi:hypothetical protein